MRLKGSNNDSRKEKRVEKILQTVKKVGGVKGGRRGGGSKGGRRGGGSKGGRGWGGVKKLSILLPFFAHTTAPHFPPCVLLPQFERISK